MDIPTIETERLILRGYTPDDFDAFAAMWADPDVVHFIGGRSFTREQSWQRFLTRAGGWQHMGFGFFAVVEKASGVVGMSEELVIPVMYACPAPSTAIALPSSL